MSKIPFKRDLVLAVHPTSRGFGWVLFEGPLAPFDWGLSKTPSDKNAKCLGRITRLIEQYQPGTLVLEAFERGASRRADRIQRLGRALVHLADNRGLEVRVLTRASIRLCFASIGAATRHEIALAVSNHIDAFRHHLPPVRKPWMSEDPRLGLFNAAAAGLSHYALTDGLVL